MKTTLKIRTQRHNIGKDQYQMAEKLKITVQEYSRIETGRDKLSEDMSAQLAGIFGRSVKDF